MPKYLQDIIKDEFKNHAIDVEIGGETFKLEMNNELLISYSGIITIHSMDIIKLDDMVEKSEIEPHTDDIEELLDELKECKISKKVRGKLEKVESLIKDIQFEL